MHLKRIVIKLMKVDSSKKFILIKCNEISFNKIREIFNKLGKVKDLAHDPLNDEASMIAMINGATITVESIFSDYLIRFPESCGEEVFELVLNELKQSKGFISKTVLKWISKLTGL